MPYLIYPLYAVLSLVANILAWLLCFPMAALSVATGKNVSPWPLSLLHTVDNTLDGGQDELHWPKVTGWRLVLQRAQWIARNPAQGFDCFALGIPRGPMTKVTKIKEVAAVGFTGYVEIYRLEYKGRKYFSYRTNRWWLGWNPHDYPNMPCHFFKFSLRND